MNLQNELVQMVSQDARDVTRAKDMQEDEFEAKAWPLRLAIQAKKVIDPSGKIVAAWSSADSPLAVALRPDRVTLVRSTAFCPCPGRCEAPFSYLFFSFGMFWRRIGAAGAFATVSEDGCLRVHSLDGDLLHSDTLRLGS